MWEMAWCGNEELVVDLWQHSWEPAIPAQCRTCWFSAALKKQVPLIYNLRRCFGDLVVI